MEWEELDFHFEIDSDDPEVLAWLEECKRIIIDKLNNAERHDNARS